jgi:hypothetical protein
MLARLVYEAECRRRRVAGRGTLMTGSSAATKLHRTAFQTSRLLDFCSRKELIAQTGHGPNDWPLVVLKELVDNALDACEEAGVAPKVNISVDDSGITVTDNGPGLPADVVASILDFSIRVSSREAYVAPDRGAQGNALKTLVAMPFILDGETGTSRSTLAASGTRSLLPSIRSVRSRLSGMNTARDLYKAGPA